VQNIGPIGGNQCLATPRPGRPGLCLATLGLAVSLVLPACGGSEVKEVKEPRQPAADERVDAARLLARAIEAQEAGKSELADERYARAVELEPAHYELAERY